jgi:hypothetical protein
MAKHCGYMLALSKKQEIRQAQNNGVILSGAKNLLEYDSEA